MASASSGLNLSTPMAAASKPTIPLFVGNSAVVRRVKREAKPHDCIGPSSKRARHELLDMVCEAFNEVLKRDFRDARFRVASNSPGLLQFLAMFQQPRFGFGQQP